MSLASAVYHHEDTSPSVLRFVREGNGSIGEPGHHRARSYNERWGPTIAVDVLFSLPMVTNRLNSHQRQNQLSMRIILNSTTIEKIESNGNHTRP